MKIHLQIRLKTDQLRSPSRRKIIKTFSFKKCNFLIGAPDLSVLERTFSKCSFTDKLGPVLISQDTGHDFSCRGRSTVDQNGERAFVKLLILRHIAIRWPCAIKITGLK